MTMQRSEYTDPDSSRRFPVEAGSATTSAAGTGGTAPALAGAITSATATEVRQADVLSGRGKSFTKHHGNLRFDEIIKQRLRRYFSVATHTEKKLITEEIVDEVTSLGRFLRFDKGREKWMVMGREAARIKVAQALQYRHRRVAKGLESMDDSLEQNPLPLSHPGQQAVPQHMFPPIPAQVASIFNQDGLLDLLQHSDRSHQQQQHGEWGAIRRQSHQQQQQQCVLPQPHLSQQDHQRHRQLDLDHDSSSMHAAAVHRQLQQQQRDQQIHSDQLENLIGQRRLPNLHDNPSSGHLAGAGAAAAATGPLYNVAGGPLYAAGLGHLDPMDLHHHHHHRDSDRNVHAASAVSQEQHHQPLLAQLSLAALEPRPVLFRSNGATVTGVPSGFGSHHTTNTVAVRRTDHPSFRPVRSSSGGNHQGHNPWPESPGQHHRPQGAATTTHPHRSQPSAAAAAGVAVAAAHHQQEEDSDDDASLADLLTDDVEDDPSADGHEPVDTHSLSWQDDPSFGDRHGS